MKLLKPLLFTLSGMILFSCGQHYDFGLPAQSDTFPSSVQYNNKVDMVFMVDDSGSMAYHQEKLRSGIPILVQNLLSLKLDFHIVVISTSMLPDKLRGGKFLGSPSVLTNSTPDLINNLSQRLQLGSNGANRVSGLQSIMVALSDDYLNGGGKNFFREDALLSVVAVSNGDDHSALGDINYYTKFFDARKKPFDNGDRSWVFNFIGTLDNSPTCPTNPDNNFTERGDTFIALANASKGQTESICASDLSPAVTHIKARIIQVLTDYKLTRKPDLATVRVYANNQLVPHDATNGWDYIADGNLIRFYGSWIPASDVVIRVDFKPATAD